MGEPIDRDLWERAMQAGVAAKVATYARLLGEQGVDAALIPNLVVSYQDNELDYERKRRDDEEAAQARFEATLQKLASIPVLT